MHFISYILRDVPGVLSLVSSFLQAIYTSFCMPLICLLTVTQSDINLHKAVSTYEVDQRTCLRYPYVKDKVLIEETGSTQYVTSTQLFSLVHLMFKTLAAPCTTFVHRTYVPLTVAT